MGDWDAPAPWYVYTFGGLALAWLGCLGNDQWRWALYTGLALAANVLLLVWVYWAKKKSVKNDPEPRGSIWPYVVYVVLSLVTVYLANWLWPNW